MDANLEFYIDSKRRLSFFAAFMKQILDAIPYFIAILVIYFLGRKLIGISSISSVERFIIESIFELFNIIIIATLVPRVSTAIYYSKKRILINPFAVSLVGPKGKKKTIDLSHMQFAYLEKSPSGFLTLYYKRTNAIFKERIDFGMLTDKDALSVFEVLNRLPIHSVDTKTIILFFLKAFMITACTMYGMCIWSIYMLSMNINAKINLFSFPIIFTSVTLSLLYSIRITLERFRFLMR